MKDKQSYETRDEICLLLAYYEWCSKEWMDLREEENTIMRNGTLPFFSRGVDEWSLVKICPNPPLPFKKQFAL